MPHVVKFNWRAYDTIRYPLPTGPIALFTDEVPYCADRVTAKAEAEILNWLLATPAARDLLLTNLDLPAATYAQTSIIEPILDRRPTRKPGDLDMLLVPQPSDPSRVISIQAKRVKVEAISTYRDDVSNRHVGNLTDVVEQANGSRELGFHLNYAMVVVQIDGIERSEFNFLARTTTDRQFNRIYHRAWDSPLHSDVGLIFIEISQPTGASIDNAGFIAISVDKRAKPLDQPVALNARIRQLVQQRHSA
jgi:hypothetical protein